METSGFTLVELLVTLAGVALLAAVAAGIYPAALQAAQAASCRSNLRQLAAANHAYALDHGRFVAAASDMDGNNRMRWHGMRRGSSFDAADGPLTPYLGGKASSEGLRRCPAFRPKENGFEASCGGYGYNAVGIGSVEYCPHDNEGAAEGRFKTVGIRPALLKHPASTLMFSDAAFLQGSGSKAVLTEYSFCEPPRRPDGTRPWPSIHFRHRGCANVVWADGHAGSEPRTQTGAKGAAEGLGWFGPDDDSLFSPF
jgi:prepilin-type processing-associated H-X9-DG protein